MPKAHLVQSPISKQAHLEAFGKQANKQTNWVCSDITQSKKSTWSHPWVTFICNPMDLAFSETYLQVSYYAEFNIVASSNPAKEQGYLLISVQRVNNSIL